MHFSCWFTTDALGWSKTSKNLRDFESRVEVCLQDLNFFKKYPQSWGKCFLCRRIQSSRISLTHTPAEIQLISCKRRGRRKQPLMGQCEGAGSRSVEPGAGWVLLQLSPALLITVFYSVFKTCVTRWRVGETDQSEPETVFDLLKSFCFLNTACFNHFLGGERDLWDTAPVSISKLVISYRRSKT